MVPPRYVPFTRTDRYGEGGAAPQPLLSILLLYLSAVTVVPIKAMLAVLGVIAANLSFRVCDLLPAKYRTRCMLATGKFFPKAVLFVLGFVYIKWVKVEPQDKDKATPPPAGIVCNHMSWCDILIMMSRYFPSFVARDGTQRLPLIGFISQKLQCLYVNREAKGQGIATLVKERILKRAADPSTTDRPMLLFPEGTTTNNRFLLRFKTGGFLAGQPVLPVIIKYRNYPFSPCWESIPIGKHIFLLLAHLWHGVTCYELPVYVPSEQEKQSPELFAENVRQYMIKHSGLLPASDDASFESKKEYLELLKQKASKSKKTGNGKMVHVEAKAE